MLSILNLCQISHRYCNLVFGSIFVSFSLFTQFLVLHSIVNSVDNFTSLYSCIIIHIFIAEVQYIIYINKTDHQLTFVQKIECIVDISTLII